MAKLTVTKQKEKTWNAFSLFIRRRDCIIEDGFRSDYAACCTCGIVLPWRNQQAGHFIPGRRNSILFDEKNCHAQCKACNVFKNGNAIAYFLFMEKQYGRKTINRLIKQSHEIVKYTIDDLKEIEALYKQKFNEFSM